MNNYLKNIGLISIVLILIASPVLAQQGEDDDELSNQEVDVYTTFTPEISDAFRMETLPEISDTAQVKPEFEYDIYSKLVQTKFNPDPLKAAKLKGQPKDALENGFARLGLGSKLMLDAEVYYNNTRDNDLNWGIRGIHNSGHGRLDNRVRDNVYAGYNKNLVGVNAKKMYTETTLTGSLNFRSNQHFFYGYNTNNVVLPTDFIRPVTKADFLEYETWQRYNLLSVRTEAKSRFHKHEPLNYRVMLNYDFWFDARSNQEHYLDFALNLNKSVKKEKVGADAGLILTPANYKDITPMYIKLAPYLQHNTEDFKVKLGLNAQAKYAGDSSSYHFYPDIHIEHNIADVLLPYASFTGNLTNHSLSQVTMENPYVRDTIGVEDSNIKQHIILGFKGRISEEVQFNINGHYIKADNQHFFVNEYASTLRNRFDVAYSDVEMFYAYGELNFDFGNKFGLRPYGKYRHYTWLKDIDKAWHVPTVEAGLYSSFKVMPQLTVSADAFVMIDRYAPVMNDQMVITSQKLDPVIDVNLGARYLVSNKLSAFVQLNNLAGQNYEIWNQYPVYGFHVMTGINYSF
jgi:hypothetical protein